MEPAPSSSGLGSLAQSARGKQLSHARWILIAVGALNIALGGFLFYNAPNEVKQAINQEIQGLQRQGQVPLPGAVKDAEERELRVRYLIYGSSIALAIVFVILGILVYAFPVVATVLGLVLYIGAHAVLAVLNPMSLVQGWIVKILIIVGLFKAVQSAIAYQKEESATATPEF